MANVEESKIKEKKKVGRSIRRGTVVESVVVKRGRDKGVIVSRAEEVAIVDGGG